MRPKYLRHNIWDPESELTPTTAEWSETAIPLPRPPQSALEDPVVTNTIRNNPHLFSIVTPINVEVFEAYLSRHPNRPFVESICCGLREGFWPWADTHIAGYPTTHNESRQDPVDPIKSSFLATQLAVEQSRGRFSEAFGSTLLPGMYCMPIYAVPKPNSTDLRLVTDQSYGSFSLNSMIKHTCVTGYPLDNLTQYGEMLLNLAHCHPDEKRVSWKSDIAEAYRLMPMHPYWQVKQANWINGEFFIDRCNAFGGCGSGAIFIAFNSLVAWIAKNEKGVSRLSTYVDDSSGCGLANDTLFYHPYQKFFPREQVILMQLWDELGVPHREKKQVWGSPLTIIGIDVDPNEMVLTLPEASRERLMKELRFWCRKGAREKTKKWFQMGGWFNWALNVYPLLRPALNNFYPKLKGRKESTVNIHVNNAVREDFEWAIRKLDNSSGVFLLKSLSWDVENATQMVYCDACLEGMGFWYPHLQIAFIAPTPAHWNPNLIFYFEALCVLCALWDIHQRSPCGSRLVIYTDNYNTVNIFNTLRCLPEYNHLLKASVDILVDGDHSLRVLHVPGTENDVADALSRSQFSRALQLEPNLRISSFDPWVWTRSANDKMVFEHPQSMLGVEGL